MKVVVLSTSIPKLWTPFAFYISHWVNHVLYMYVQISMNADDQ